MKCLSFWTLLFAVIATLMITAANAEDEGVDLLAGEAVHEEAGHVAEPHHNEQWRDGEGGGYGGDKRRFSDEFFSQLDE